MSLMPDRKYHYAICLGLALSSSVLYGQKTEKKKNDKVGKTEKTDSISKKSKKN